MVNDYYRMEAQAGSSWWSRSAPSNIPRSGWIDDRDCVDEWRPYQT